MPVETRFCENCEAKVGKDEKICPACKIDLEHLDDALSDLEALNKIAANRKKKTEPPPEPRRGSMFGGMFRK
jgi:predicted amidophosphoribosyltransferase